jgi:uncharacterized RDD family membrane protein YckC
MSTEIDKELDINISKASGSLLDFEDHLYLASHGKRLLNYIIDMFVFYVVLIIFVAISASAFVYQDNSTATEIIYQIFGLILYALLSGLFETIFKGKTIGKFLTQTRTVYTDGTQINAKTAFLRGFAKMVPFCAFSALGSPCHPWQDRWTDTYVIDEKRSRIHL